MKISNLFSLPAFILSFLIGLVFVYLSDKPYKVVYIYPTPENIHKFQYIDKASNCFEYEAKEVHCPSDINKIKLIPVQQ
jgi:hypothetical protein